MNRPFKCHECGELVSLLEEPQDSIEAVELENGLHVARRLRCSCRLHDHLVIHEKPFVAKWDEHYEVTVELLRKRGRLLSIP